MKSHHLFLLIIQVLSITFENFDNLQAKITDFFEKQKSKENQLQFNLDQCQLEQQLLEKCLSNDDKFNASLFKICLNFSGNYSIEQNLECYQLEFIKANESQLSCNIICSNDCNQCQFESCQSNLNFIDNQLLQILPKYQLITNDCQIECLDCQSQICYQCWNGWSLIDDQCQQICGDGLIAINSLEECDDGNDEIGDGCYDCKMEWCSPYCVDCVIEPYPICNRCQDYFEIVGDKDCQPICGDEIVVEGIEVCDGWSLLYFDTYYASCENCQIQCMLGCCQCVYGFCMDEEFYDSYFEYLDVDCEFFLSQSQLYYFDYDVSYYCDQTQYCLFTQNIKVCYFNDLRYTFSKQFDCISNQLQYFHDICGDGIIGLTESCDDGNGLNDDGCSNNCVIEYVVEENFLNLVYSHRYLDMQYVDIQFGDKVKFVKDSIDFSSRFTYILLFKNEDENYIEMNQVIYTLLPVVEFSAIEFKYVKYVLQIQFLEFLSLESELQIHLNSSDIINSRNESPSQSQQSVALKPVYEDLVKASKLCQKIGSTLIVVLGVSSVLILIFSNFTDCFEILDVLQYQSYLRYINIVQPENLKCFFESFDSVTITPFLNKFKLFSFYSFTIGFRYADSIGQFLQYQFNADLLSNIYGQFSQIIGSIIILTCLVYYKRYYYKKCFSEQHFNTLKEKDSKCLKFLAYGFYFLNNLFFRIGKLMSQSGYRELFLANVWDLTLKVLLFLASTNTYDFRNVVSYIFSMIYFIGLFLFLITHFIWKKKYVPAKEFEKQQFEAVIVLKKILFLVFLIFFQYDPILQSSLLTIVILTYICVLFISKSIKSNLEKAFTILIELSILIFTSISIFQSSDFRQETDEDKNIKFAFTQISALILGLTTPIFKHSILIVIRARNFYLKRKTKIKSLEQPKKEVLYNSSKMKN